MIETTREFSPRLRTLARHSLNAENRARNQKMASRSDDLSHLSEERRASWTRLLSSVATTESLEFTLLEPLLQAKASYPEVIEYLESHAADEQRHFSLLTAYLKNTFSFEKKTRTWSDQILYDRAFPQIARLFGVRPLLGFALIHCYEKFSLCFYGPLRSAAQADGAQNLLTLIQNIEKDELRHVAGMEQMMRAEIQANHGLGIADTAAVRAILELMLLDVDMRPWAFHNREIRGHLQNLGVDADELTRTARATARDTIALMKEMAKSC